MHQQQGFIPPPTPSPEMMDSPVQTNRQIDDHHHHPYHSQIHHQPHQQPLPHHVHHPHLHHGHHRHPQSQLDFLPPDFLNHLLQQYFNFVHNVWPVVYKPAFHISRASPVLTKAILAIAACISEDNNENNKFKFCSPSSSSAAAAVAGGDSGPASVGGESGDSPPRMPVMPGGAGVVDVDALFAEAEQALLETGLQSHVETIQALVLMSLRQTGCGNKSSAWMYAGMLPFLLYISMMMMIIDSFGVYRYSVDDVYRLGTA
jgi:hypothetical protein